jgi:hypothetical protein
MTAAQRSFASWMTDVLVYIVVLNLYVEYSESKVIDSFTISILTALLLKGIFDLIKAGKSRVWAWSQARNGRIDTAIGALGVWLILFLSKFVILETVDFVFGEHVELGTFIDVMLLSAAMMASRGLVQYVYIRLGAPRT